MLWATTVLVLTFAIPWLDPLSAAFGVVPMPLGTLAAIVAILIGYICATEAVKACFFRTGRQTRAAPVPREGTE
jgi:Mg2+-importing ATPase